MLPFDGFQLIFPFWIPPEPSARFSTQHNPNQQTKTILPRSQYSRVSHGTSLLEIAKATPTLEPRAADGVLPRTSPGAMGVESESAQVGASATKLQRPRLGFKPISNLANVEEDSVLTNLAWSFSDPAPAPTSLSAPHWSRKEATEAARKAAGHRFQGRRGEAQVPHLERCGGRPWSLPEHGSKAAPGAQRSDEAGGEYAFA